MSALLPVTVNGVEFQAHGEFTSAKVAQDFQNSLAAFVNIFNLGLDQSIDGVDPDSVTLAADIRAKLDDPEYATQLLNALIGGSVTKNYEVTGDPNRTPTAVEVTGLLNLLKNGLNVTDDPVLRPGQHYLSLEMAGAVEQLVRSLQMAGVNIQPDGSGGLQVIGGITATMIKNWRNLSASSDAIRRIIQYAGDASGNQNRTLQALVELIYVRTGNEMLSDSLERLEGAIEVTKGSLDALNRLQTLHNKITAEDKDKFKNVASHLYVGSVEETTTYYDASAVHNSTRTTTRTITPTMFVRGYNGQGGVNEAADNHFTPIDPTILEKITEADRIEFLSLRKDIMEEIRALSGQQGGDDEAGTLLEKLRTVLADINKAFSAVGVSANGIVSTDAAHVKSALTRWILDSTGAASTALNIPGIEPGQIQRNLTAAISAGQSLNDTQKEEVRRYLFVFEEYYKSAASILSKITQILERMAQAIAR
jgi:hypothetical protein